MKYLKTKNISNFSIADRSFIVEQPSGKITTNSQNSIKVPTGAIERRPTVAEQGMLRFTTSDTSTHEDPDVENYFPGRPIGIEIYFNNQWIPLRLQGPSTITKYFAGLGTWNESLDTDPDLSRYFPISGDPLPIVPASADSIIVIIENVFQVSDDNFELYESSGEIVGIEVTDGGTNYNTPANVSAIIDDPFSGGAWASTTAVTAGDYIYYINSGVQNWYEVLTTGTTGSTPPTHTTGSNANGTTTLTYVGTTARATVTIEAGVITRATIIDQGSGYTSTPTVTFNDSGAEGSDAAGTARIAKIGWHIKFLGSETVPDGKPVYIYYGFNY